MRSKIKPEETEKKGVDKILRLILKALPLAMGIALIMLSILKKDLDHYTVAAFAGIGLFAVSLYQLHVDKE